MKPITGSVAINMIAARYARNEARGHNRASPLRRRCVKVDTVIAGSSPRRHAGEPGRPTVEHLTIAAGTSNPRRGVDGAVQSTTRAHTWPRALRRPTTPGEAPRKEP